MACHMTFLYSSVITVWTAVRFLSTVHHVVFTEVIPMRELLEADWTLVRWGGGDSQLVETN